MNYLKHLKFSPPVFHQCVLVTVIALATMLINPPATGEEPAPQPPLTSTLAFHLATNLVGRVAGHPPDYKYKVELDAPYSMRLTHYGRASWSDTFWLKGIKGLSATPIGYRDQMSGQGLMTMVSPRHYLCATHMHPEGRSIAFLDTNNVIHWRNSLAQRVDVGGDTTVGILDADVPPSVGFLPVLPDDFTNYLPTGTNVIQGIGMNQDMYLFGQPMRFISDTVIAWNVNQAAPFGLSTNWNIKLRGGDSSNPEMILVGNQLVLVSHNFTAGSGPNYARQISAINRAMHELSTNNQVQTDYQLTEFSLTNWPVIH